MDVTEIVQKLGGATSAARRLGEKRSTVSMWLVTGRLPLHHVPKVAKALDVPASEIWPELAQCRAMPAKATAGPVKDLPLFPSAPAQAERAA